MTEWTDERTGAYVSAGLPVAHVQLEATFYPRTGKGNVSMYRYTETGRGEPDPETYVEPFGWADAGLVVPRLAETWCWEVARLTQWDALAQALEPRFLKRPSPRWQRWSSR